MYTQRGRHRQEAMMLRRFGVDRDGLLQKAVRGSHVLLLTAVHQRQRAHNAFPTVEARGRFALDSETFSEMHLRFDRGHDIFTDFVLHRETVDYVAVETLSPNLLVNNPIDQLHGDPSAPRHFADTALQN